MIRKIAIALLSAFAFAEERNLEEKLGTIRELWVNKLIDFGKTEEEIDSFNQILDTEAAEDIRGLEEEDYDQFDAYIEMMKEYMKEVTVEEIDDMLARGI